MFIHFFCLCPLSLTIKLNFNISKVAYCLNWNFTAMIIVYFNFFFHLTYFSFPLLFFIFNYLITNFIFFSLRTFARNFSNIDFFLKILPLKDDELAMSGM